MRHLLVAIAVIVLTLAGVPATAQSTPELLEKGIYTEETVGDLDRAIEIYGTIVDEAVAHRPYVAEALFRLGMCHIKNDDSAAATEAFERILLEFSDQERFAAMARENMPDDPEALEILPAPWDDGEVMRLTIKLASGTKVGTMLMAADSAEVDGDEFWRLRVRRRIFSDSDNQAISEVLARRDDMAPVKSLFKHNLVGHFEAAFGDDAVKITTVGPDTTREEKFEVRLFDNEEGFHLFRRLPLKVGYKARVHVIATLAGGPTAVDVEVVDKEMVKVPAGEFECFRMKFSVPQTFWYSTDPSHTLVKFEGSGVTGELDEVFRRDPGQRLVHRDDERNFDVSLPPEWLSYELAEGNVTTLLLLDPMADARARVEVRRSALDPGSCAGNAASWRKLGQAREVLSGYKLRDGAWREGEISGRPSVSFIGDYTENDREMVHYWTFVDSGELCLEFTLKSAADRFEALRAGFDTIVDSYDGPRSEIAETAPLSPAEQSVKTVINDFHLAAAQADTERYFQRSAPDLVFLASDPSERFDIDQLRAFAEPYFSQGKGWVATPTEQHVVVAEGSKIAWFDERLESVAFGEMRASGVLRQDDDGWRIVQYNVGFPVPNALARDLAEKIRSIETTAERLVADPPAPVADDPARAARELLGDLHRAKSEADGERFFGHLAPDAIFLGTDRSERFTVEQYRAFAGPYFDRGIKQISVPLEQNVFLSPDGKVAWFDERLDRAEIGELRGTGVLRKVDGEWKVAHYNLIFPVPNDLTKDLVERIRAFYAP